MLQVPGQHITAVAMIPDIDNNQVSVTVNGSTFATSLIAQVQVSANGKQVVHFPLCAPLIVLYGLLLRSVYQD